MDFLVIAEVDATEADKAKRYVLSNTNQISVYELSFDNFGNPVWFFSRPASRDDLLMLIADLMGRFSIQSQLPTLASVEAAASASTSTGVVTTTP